MGKEGVVFMKYLKYLIKQDDILTDDGEIVEVYELSDNIDPTSFDEWANHFRNQYCPDGMIVPSQEKWTQKSFKKRNESQYFVGLRKPTAFIPRFA